MRSRWSWAIAGVILILAGGLLTLPSRTTIDHRLRRNRRTVPAVSAAGER